MNFFRNAVSLFNKGCLFQFIVCVQKFVSAFFQLTDLLLYRPVFPVNSHRKIENRKMQQQNDKIGKILRRSTESRSKKIIHRRNDYIRNGIHSDIDGKHDHIVFESVGRKIKLRKNKCINNVIKGDQVSAFVFPVRKERQKNEQNAVEHIPSNFSAK